MWVLDACERWFATRLSSLVLLVLADVLNTFRVLLSMLIDFEPNEV